MPFPFADGTGSPVLDELVGGPAAALTAVALVVAPGARASGWGARAAAALAANWRGPRRVLLADLDLERPALHEGAGLPNEEGVIDLIEYGLSVSRLIRSAAGGSYDLLPAGIFTPDPGAVLRHEGWSRVLIEIAARRGTLLAWVPSDADGADAVVQRSGAVLVLAEPGEGREVVERLPHPYAVLGILTAEEHRAEEAVAGTDPIVLAAAAEAVVDAAPDAAEAAPESIEESPHPAVEAPTFEDVLPPDVDAAAAAPELPGRALAGGTDRDIGAAATEAAALGGLAAGPSGEASEGGSRAEVEAPADIGEPRDVAGDDLLSSDPAAREALSRELRERQRAARLAGAAPAPDYAGPAEAAPREAGTPSQAPTASSGVPAAPAAAGGAAQASAAPPAAAPGGAAPPAAAPPAAASGASMPADSAASGAEAVRELRIRDEQAPRSEAGPPRPPEAGESRPAKTVSPPPRRTRSRYRRPLIWTVGVVLLASLLAGAWHYLSGRLERTPAVAAPPEPAPAPPAAPAEQNALPFVVAIEAHRELLVALNRVTDLSEIEPELLFHVEPLVREGTLFYHVMAGPVPDSAAALALRDTLIARGHKTGPTPTDVRATPLAFLIGDYGTPAAADEQREILRRLNLPGYVLRGTAADGAPLYRLYVGGFASEAEADVTRQMLRSAGIRDSLVTRTGIVTQPEDIDTEADSVVAALSPGNTNEK